MKNILLGLLLSIVLGYLYFTLFTVPVSSGVLLGFLLFITSIIASFILKRNPLKRAAHIISFAGAFLCVGTFLLIIFSMSNM